MGPQSGGGTHMKFDGEVVNHLSTESRIRHDCFHPLHFLYVQTPRGIG